MRPRSPHPPQTPAERQAKCRAIKPGEWHTIPGTQMVGPPTLSPPTAQSFAALPPAPTATAPLALPPAAATGLALPDVITSHDASRLSLPAAVAARLQSLLDR